MSKMWSQVWEGNGVVASARKLIGATNPLNAEPGTIRGDLCIQTGRNIVHGSDSPDNGERETGGYFSQLPDEPRADRSAKHCRQLAHMEARLLSFGKGCNQMDIDCF